MKEFSKEWKASSKPRKQVKYGANAPLHIRHKFLNAKLTKDASKKYGITRIAVKKGDRVKILRGQYKGRTGKINRVDMLKTRIFIDGAEKTKIDGSKSFYPIHPSNVLVVEMNTDDKRRTKRKAK